jgi:ribosome-associated translation inhibitor RaiA
MIQVKFKNLEKSEMIKKATVERIEALIVKFPDLKRSKIQATLEMENSPTQAGPDLFNVKFHVIGGRYNGVTIVKDNSNLYAALADVIDHMLEKLNRFGDRARVKEISKARKIARKYEHNIERLVS